MLTLGDLVQDWRGGKLLRPRGTDRAQAEATAAAGGGAAQELDPAGVARALRLLFERVSEKTKQKM